MTVATLQLFLRSLIPALQSTGGPRIAAELELAAKNLEPFASTSLDAFAAFLGRCVDYEQGGRVTAPATFNFDALQSALARLESADNTDAIKAVQVEIVDQLRALGASGGFTVTTKPQKGWLDARLGRSRVAGHVKALRELASKISGVDSYEQEDVRDEMKRIADIPAADWKFLRPEFGLAAKAKGAKAVEDVLFQLSGFRPPTTKGKRIAAVDQVRVALHAHELREMLARAQVASAVTDAEIENLIRQLKLLSLPELKAVAVSAGVEKAGTTAKAILNRLHDRLTSSRRIVAETEV